MEQLKVGLGQRSYPIWIGDDILDNLGRALKEVDFPRKVAVVTNPTVGGLYAERVLEALAKEGFHAETVTVPDGEQFKNLETLETIYDGLIENGLDRFSGLVALGGGVVGDMAGFAAATYLRGIPFAQVPTTLLSQVDSSVGGKTAVNHPLGKNLIGAFYQPRHVHIDVATLTTLPHREFAAGMAEVVKYGIIRDRSFFDWLGSHRSELQRLDRTALIEAVKRSCQIKANVVEVDENESSLRAILNFGHTFGHAVETLAGYGQIKHGEAVAIGMVVAAVGASTLDLCTSGEVDSIRELLASFGLPVEPPSFSLEDYLNAMGRDKKVKEGVLRLVLNRGIGDCLLRDIAEPAGFFASVLNTLPMGR
ncbi:3-dehydroquinate synthase [uncultured Desulfuromonas sp.]|uniref:3-dehydroquinate synthase n=1 Tax=uncultured Desulfuromonas sp. TaxID=181013 RepID=UPI002614F1EE|nr:3-dehydroquinate synthase [uncultured Desulfuromonas sp.]